MRILFTVAIFVGSGLLFLVEPMVAKMILPRFGGAPAVWTASIVFFQSALLLGYAYAHLSVKWLGPRRQAVIHAFLVLLGFMLLPIAMPTGGGSISAGTVFVALAGMAGVPFFLLSAGAPLIQRWFAGTNHDLSSEPYFLYAASNLGSVVALLGYPVLIEPNMGLAEQARLWKAGYAVLAILLLACAIGLWRQEEAPHKREETFPAPSWQTRFRWIALAAIPASLLLGVTTHITVEIAPMPLLWVLPLALYLLSFVFAFARHPILTSKPLSWIALILVAPLCVTLLVDTTSGTGLQFLIHLGAFFFLAWACHRTVAESRPSAGRLTEFFFLIAVGGVAGGLFNALVAPLIFKSLVEYPVAVVAALLLLRTGRDPLWRPRDLLWAILPATVGLGLMLAAVKWDWGTDDRTLTFVLGLPVLLSLATIHRSIAYALSLSVLFIAAGQTNVANGGVRVFSNRSFFGVHEVEIDGAEHRLMSGTTVHGVQDMTPENRAVPLTYYGREGPIGQLMEEEFKGGRKPATAIVGLGAGTMAAYGQPGQRLDFYEIDPTVVETARKPELFTYVSECKANLSVFLGDARQSLEGAQDRAYDVIVLDAFSSDAIPVHLLTKEAVSVYLTRLAPGGVLAFHITNRYVDLAPVLASAARDLGLAAIEDEDYGYPDDSLVYDSDWLVLARSTSSFGSLAASEDWKSPKIDPRIPAWTDDKSSILWLLIGHMINH